jgi:hypothetical protein
MGILFMLMEYVNEVIFFSFFPHNFSDLSGGTNVSIIP